MNTLMQPEEIATLPDNLLGQTQILGAGGVIDSVATNFFISDFVFSDIILIRELVFGVGATTPVGVWFSFAVGDRVPTTDAGFLALTPLFRSAPFLDSGIPSFISVGGASNHFDRFRILRETGGRRLVMRTRNTIALAGIGAGIIVYNSISMSIHRP